MTKEAYMKFFLNSCEVEKIKEAYDWGIVDGITMNPTMVAALNKDYVRNLREICGIVDVPVFAQVLSPKAEDIVKEAKALASIDKKIIVKIHFNPEGTKAIKMLRDSEIETCATGMHTVIEAVAAERAGADHVAMFVGLLGEADEKPTDVLISGTRKAFDYAKATTKIMAAVRSVNQLMDAACNGADEMTAAYNIYKFIYQNGYTINRWNSFASDWKKAYGERNWITGY